ncbi:MAG: radical SAM protein [Campylobacter sp.]|nr:radical SAM protein [Campylobacter sp.]
MKIVFGPISSRRFGLSLGVDLSPALKQCNFDCVYCELSAAKGIKQQNLVVSVKEILDEVSLSLEKGVEFDVLTLTANGEPSLYPHLKELIMALKKMLKDKKILILSNGTAVLDRDKFEALLELDIVKLSLDSAISKTFYKIDRALKSIDLNLMIEKMTEFSKLFKGELVIEILVVSGFNDTIEEFKALDKALEKISPLRVDLSTIDRPPAYPVKAVSEQKLNELAKFIKSVPVVIAKRHFSEEKKLDLSKEELLKMLYLRPQNELDVQMKFSDETLKNLNELLTKGRVRILDLAGVKFYKADEIR